MRRLPGPAVSRLSEGDRTLEALYELFRDWQRTQTQSSVTAPRSLRQQMDVWFCRAQEPMPGGIRCALTILEVMTCTLSRACPGHPCLRLTDDLHGRRLFGNNPVDRQSDLRLSYRNTGRSQPVDATPSDMNSFSKVVFMAQGKRERLSTEQRIDLWRRWKAGESLHDIGRAFGKGHGSIRFLLTQRGGIVPAARRRSLRTLTLAEREDISRGIASGSSIREIASGLQRPVSTVSREVSRHGGRPLYRASEADRRECRERRISRLDLRC